MKTHHHTVVPALMRVLRPLIRVLLRLGVPYGTFAEIAKHVYVEVADADFPPPGRKQSDSRVATITGLTRKDVVRLKKTPVHDDPTLLERFNRAARVIGGWVNDGAFQRNGQPRRLQIDTSDASQPQFGQLVQRYSGDVPMRAILDELVRVGAVNIEDGYAVLVRPAYVPTDDIDAKIGILGTDAGDLIATIDRNLATPDDSRFQLTVAYDHLPKEALALFHQQVSEQGFELLKRFDAYLREHDRDSNPQATGTGRYRAGVGIYYFEEPLDEDTP